MENIKMSAKEKFHALKQTSASFKEKNDCSVIAIALVCGVEYEVAHDAMAEFNRKNGKGASTGAIIKAVEKLGFKAIPHKPKDFINNYPTAHRVLKCVTTHHPERFHLQWHNGKNYLFFMTSHVAAVIDGKTCDWTEGRSKRVWSLYEVQPAS